MIGTVFINDCPNAHQQDEAMLSSVTKPCLVAMTAANLIALNWGGAKLCLAAVLGRRLCGQRAITLDSAMSNNLG